MNAWIAQQCSSLKGEELTLQDPVCHWLTLPLRFLAAPDGVNPVFWEQLICSWLRGKWHSTKSNQTTNSCLYTLWEITCVMRAEVAIRLLCGFSNTRCRMRAAHLRPKQTLNLSRKRVQDNVIYSNVINELHQKSSKCNLIILPKICNLMDYVTDYILCHVIWNN